MDLIVIPTYDERETIAPLLTDLLGRPELQDTHVLVVDDSSPDGTAAVVRAVPGFGTRVHLLERAVKDGLGGAYRAGFAWALARPYDAVVQMDADGSHPVETIDGLLSALVEHDVAIGSRYVAQGRTLGWSWHRRALSRWANRYVRAVLGLDVHDATAGFRAFRAPALARVLGAGGPTHASGYCFQVETTWRAQRCGLRVTEVPITFVERTAGHSKMTADIVAEAMWRVLTWRVQQVRAQRGSARTLHGAAQ